MNNTQLRIQNHTFSLKRFPSNHFDKSLRAWDAADEYIIDHVAGTVKIDEFKHIVIVNDSFGALTCAMARLAPLAKISVFTDSYMSELGIDQNLKGSNLDKNNVTVRSCLALAQLNVSSNEPVDLVLLKVPRTLSYLEYLLHTLNAVISTSDSASLSTSSPVFISGAMVKLVTSSVMKIFNNTMSNTSTSLARKKSRLIFCEFSGGESAGESNDHSADENADKSVEHLSTNPIPKQNAPTSNLVSQALITDTRSNQDPVILEVQDSELDFTLHNYPNVFCREQVDIGARYMLKVLPDIRKKNQVIIDLGCGNGILGTSLLLRYTKNAPKVIFVDESYMAIESAKATLHNSRASEEVKAKAEFVVGHCLDELISQNEMTTGQTLSVDYVICNPPFHQQNTVVDDIAWQMFVDAKKILKAGGELRIVGNRHLDHRAKLSKLFGGCNVVASDKKFVVLSSIKQG